MDLALIYTINAFAMPLLLIAATALMVKGLMLLRARLRPGMTGDPVSPALPGAETSPAATPLRLN
ncbi:hypothetical protein [Nesterenkonia sandarakina]|uniref:Uncharacterized protein n=1 Tax=Nesterenkonia sandarakina TaxID=272918 RepID=A0A7Z0J2Q0_9MICC|nr:hypothetical protein [Nesterenkonia sandarakina]NYJ16146.1 hypothetical protein [Nesterenkonia sandarakina]